MQKSLIEKIQKLLALSQSNHEAEAMSAMLKAQELLLKHNLTMSDIETAPVEKEKLQEETVSTFVKSPWWAYHLLNTIAENFRCIAILQKQKGHESRHTLVGMDQDVMIAREIFKYAENYLNFEIKNQKSRLKTTMKDVAERNAMANDYTRGFLKGLKEKFAKQVTEKGLVLVKDKQVTAWLAKANVSHRKAAGVSSGGNRDLYNSGYNDGKNFNHSTKQLTC